MQDNPHPAPFCKGEGLFIYQLNNKNAKNYKIYIAVFCSNLFSGWLRYGWVF